MKNFPTQNCLSAVQHIEANPDAKRLYDDLLSNYNRLIRPVVNNTETLTVWLGLKITQIIEVSLRNQVGSRCKDFHLFTFRLVVGDDDKFVGETKVVRLQASLGSRRVRRGGTALCPVGADLASGCRVV